MKRKLPKGAPSLPLLLIFLMATSPLVSISRSLPSSLFRFRGLSTVSSSSPFCPKHLPKSHPCPFWSSSFSFCLSHKTLRRSTPLISPLCISSSFSSMATESPLLSDAKELDSNPLLQDFVFPPFDIVEPKHVRPGIRALLKILV